MTRTVTLNDAADLRQFTGTEHYYRSIVPSLVYTDGVQYIAESRKAYWLIDVCMSHAHELLSKYGSDSEQAAFIVCKLVVKDNAAIFTCEDGNENETARQEIEFTDFPAGEFSLWLTGGVLMLPSEY